MVKKFIDIKEIDGEYEVWTERGFVPISKIGKTIEYEVYRLTLECGKTLEGADNHIVITTVGPKYIKDLKENIDVIVTESGWSTVKRVEKSDKKKHMYDLELSEDIRLLNFEKKDKTRYKVRDGSNKYSVKTVDNITLDDNIKVGDDYKDILFINETKQHINVTIDMCNHTYFTNGILSHNTLFLTHLTTDFIRECKDVLYITLEMSEIEINKRIDANLINIPIQYFKPQYREHIEGKFKEYFKNNPKLGQLITIEYPSGGCTVNTIRNLLKKLKREKKFIPDVVVVDQINTMGDSEKQTNMYLKIKNIVEGLKAIATENNSVVVTAAQANREALKKEDVEMDNVGESMTIAQIADVIISLKSEKIPEDLIMNDDDDIMYKGYVNCNVIKNRINGINFRKFKLEQDFRYMKLIEK